MLTNDKAVLLTESEEAEDEYWMRQALSLAKKAELAGEVPVGAVIVKAKSSLKSTLKVKATLKTALKEKTSLTSLEKKQCIDDGDLSLTSILLGEGCNQSINHHDPTGHAEISALRNTAVAISNYRITDGTTLYVTLEPCTMCAGAIIHARINRVVFAAYDLKTGAAGSVFSLLENEKNNHQVEVLGGVLEDESSSLIREFFRKRRKAKAAEKATRKLEEERIKNTEYENAVTKRSKA